MNTPYLVFSDAKGKIYHHPYLRMTASSLNRFILPKNRELIPLPCGSTLFYLPGRLPVGFDPQTNTAQMLEAFRGKKVFAVGAFPVPAYVRLYHPGAVIFHKKILPLWSYTACGYYAGKFYIAARRIDSRIRQSPRFYNNGLVKNEAEKFLRRYPQNRLYKHLAHCALTYNCLAAKNLFLKRWEAPLPTTRFCNARCIGCLSEQESDCLASHQRINFKPTADEICQVMGNHLAVAKEALVSFGQGCEGEPLLEADTIAKSIYKVRDKLSRGTINMNTNASLPAKVKLLCQAGIDSFRVSLNSPSQKLYNLYFKPRSYAFGDVMHSIAIAKKYGKFVSINLFVFPGLSDSASEIKSLVAFIRNTGIDMIQWRNLNIDPEYYLEHIPYKHLKPQGVTQLIRIIQKEFPSLKMGYFNLPKEQFY